MCVCGVGANSAIALFSFHRITAQISFFCRHQRPSLRSECYWVSFGYHIYTLKK
jgi:hypothetical protein